jgi:DNA replication licensing factor MCM4
MSRPQHVPSAPRSYSTLRRDGRSRKVVVATPRQLESFIRLAEALARMRLDPVVRRKDVTDAVSLWYRAMEGATGGDGRPDLDTLYSGTTAQQREAQRSLPAALRAYVEGEAWRAGGREQRCARPRGLACALAAQRRVESS